MFLMKPIITFLFFPITPFSTSFSVSETQFDLIAELSNNVSVYCKLTLKSRHSSC